MPLLNPEIQKALRAAGLEKGTPSPTETPEVNNVQGYLNDAGSSLEESIKRLVHIAENSTSEALRLRAEEGILKLHGVMKDQAPALPTINIIIQEPAGSVGRGVQGTNPIFLPRELIKKVQDTGGMVN